jgi:hypothetical protein
MPSVIAISLDALDEFGIRGQCLDRSDVAAIHFPVA